MIGFLQGNVHSINTDSLIILVAGVGYEVSLPVRSLHLLQESQEVQLHIYTHVREDQLKLFGFETIQEKRLFTNLIDVSGVGPKSAMAILSQNQPNEVEQAIAKADVNFFTKVKGIGKKAGQKIIIELKNKVGSLQELDLSKETDSYSNDVVSALMAFGFLRRDIIPVLKDIDQTLSEDQTIKLALQRLGKLK